MVTIYETDYSLFNEIDVAASFLSHQETSLSSVTITGKSEDDPMMGSVLKEFSESYNQVTKVASVAFKETLSETALKYLLTKVTLPENCKSAQAKLVSPVHFASVSFNKKYRYKTLTEFCNSTEYVKNDWQLYKTTFPAP